MNPEAIADHVSTTLLRWYTRVAEWMPPRAATYEPCALCRASLIGDWLDLRQWPHDLIHELAVALDAASQDVRDSFWEEADGPVPALAAQARSAVAAVVAENSADIVDILRECLGVRTGSLTS
jgi:hypothetical protein